MTIQTSEITAQNAARSAFLITFTPLSSGELWHAVRIIEFYNIREKRPHEGSEDIYTRLKDGGNNYLGIYSQRNGTGPLTLTGIYDTTDRSYILDQFTAIDKEPLVAQAEIIRYETLKAN